MLNARPTAIDPRAVALPAMLAIHMLNALQSDKTPASVNEIENVIMEPFVRRDAASLVVAIHMVVLPMKHASIDCVKIRAHFMECVDEMPFVTSQITAQSVLVPLDIVANPIKCVPKLHLNVCEIMTACWDPFVRILNASVDVDTTTIVPKIAHVSMENV